MTVYRIHLCTLGCSASCGAATTTTTPFTVTIATTWDYQGFEGREPRWAAFIPLKASPQMGRARRGRGVGGQRELGAVLARRSRAICLSALLHFRPLLRLHGAPSTDGQPSERPLSTHRFLSSPFLHHIIPPPPLPSSPLLSSPLPSSCQW
ncbi:unnamed protein product [Pleuronectes platessa]|uniref:Uncharacterized protein n=1 Tax=Pleuronectes platessa TaxID=8262 RepID=A0A9N7Z3B8_PLEPL|nr:unnamed protein product [Pleuronectes platessa]